MKNKLPMSLQTDQINIRIDAATKSAAEAVFNQLGISATDAVRMFYRQVVMRQGIPFEARLIVPIIPEKIDAGYSG
jgi:addiction module RelB/DinJ family antitoxin